MSEMGRTRLDGLICRQEHWKELTRERLEELQLRRLNELLAREKRRKGFYRDLPERLSSLKELRKLPFTTPSMLAEQGNRMLLLSQSEILRVISGETSGTSGQAKRVFYTERDLCHTVELFETGIGEMCGIGNRVLIDMPFSGEHGLGNLIERAVERTGALPLRGGGGSWKERICRIREGRPDCIIGFPVPLMGTARLYAHVYGRDDFPIRKALVSGDACPPGVLKCLEEEFSMTLFPHYGSREMALAGAITCPAHEGMHLRENHILAEIVDDAGNVLPDGEEGELVITTLDMEAMPLLRYRTGDRTRFLLEPCPCGGVTRRLDRVSRMAKDVFWMEELDDLLFPVKTLVDYRAAWDRDGLFLAARTLEGHGAEELEERIGWKYPGLSLQLEVSPCRLEEFPCYKGKRCVEKICHVFDMEGES